MFRKMAVLVIGVMFVCPWTAGCIAVSALAGLLELSKAV